MFLVVVPFYFDFSWRCCWQLHTSLFSCQIGHCYIADVEEGGGGGGNLKYSMHLHSNMQEIDLPEILCRLEGVR